MAEQRITIFAKEIEKALKADDVSFMSQSKNDNVAIGDKVIVAQETEIPDSAFSYGVTAGTGAATILESIDSTIEYLMDNAKVSPYLVKNFNETLKNYKQRPNLVAQMADGIRNMNAKTGMYNWGAQDAPHIIATSGATGGSAVPGVAGTRKKLAWKDFTDASQKMATDKIMDPTKQFWLIPSELESELLNMEDGFFIDYRKNGLVNQKSKYAPIGAILGRDVYMRPDCLLYEGTTRKVFGSAADETDCYSVMLWHKDMVRKYNGAVAGYSRVDPERYGSIFSADAKFGASKGREDFRGVVQIVQAILT